MIGLFQSWGIFVRTSLEIPIALPPNRSFPALWLPFAFLLPASSIIPPKHIGVDMSPK